jgi:hypothetical protein
MRLRGLLVIALFPFAAGLAACPAPVARDGSPGPGGEGGTGGAGGERAVGGAGGSGGTVGGGGMSGSGGKGGAQAPDAAAAVDAKAPAADASASADGQPLADGRVPADASPPPDARVITDAPPPIVDTPSCKRRVAASSIAELTAAIAAAAPGDCIVMSGGSYTTTGPIPLDRVGTAGERITIMADTVGGVTITGAAGFAVNAPAAYVTIRGFRFTHTGQLKVATGTRGCLVTRNAFEIPGAGAYLTIAGDDNEASYNSFENKSTTGAFLVLDEDAITLRPYAHHNHFRNHTYPASNGGEAIRVFATLPRVEHNLFEEIHVAGEIVSVKEGGASKGGFYRFNTFRNCTRGYFTLRYARNDVVEGNFFFATPGMRVYGANHRIINNYLEGGRINLGDGAAGAYPGIDNVEVAFNTLVNARIVGEDRGLVAIAPRNMRITNNIIQVDGGSAIGPPHPWVDVTYAGNILWGSAAPGDIPESGFRRVDPQLAATPGGGYRLGPTSPAVNAAVGAATVGDDIEGQPRVMPDVGADELSNAPAARHPLTPADVGPGGR